MVELSKSSENDEAETKVCQISQSLDCNVNKKNSDACHWLKDKEEVFVMFSQRKNCHKVLKAKKELQKLNTTNLDPSEGSKVIVN